MYGPSRKRSFDDNNDRDGNYKRSRVDDRLNGPSRRRGERSHESERARSWRLAKKAIVELGDGVEHEQLKRTSELVVEELEADAQDVKLGHVATLVLRCASRLAHKTALYATLIGLVNVRVPAFGREIVTRATDCFQRDLAFFHLETNDEVETSESDAFRRDANVAAISLRIRLIVRLLAALCSVHVCHAENVVTLLDTLQGHCTTVDDTNHDHNTLSLRAQEDESAWQDFLSFIVLETLLYSGYDLVQTAETRVQNLVTRSSAYIFHRTKPTNLRGGTLSWRTRRLQLALLWQPETEDQVPALCAASDPLTLVWDAVQAIQCENEDGMTAEAWQYPGRSHPQQVFLSDVDHGTPHEFTLSVSIDLTKLDSTKLPSYTPWFRILSEDSGTFGAAIAKLPLPSYLILRTQFATVLETLSPKPSLAATVLLGYCRASNARFAAETSTVPAIKTEYLLIETLLGAALLDHETPAHLGAYCAVLYHLVKSEPTLLSPAVAVLVELCFRQVPSMRAAAVESFGLLFSHFLSNFDFKWRWKAWDYVLEASEDDPQRLFLSTVIERCVRLSYLDHMARLLPSEFHCLLPPAPQPRIRFTSTVDDDKTGPAPPTRFYHDITTKLASHPPDNVFRAWLDEALLSVELDRNEAVEIVWTSFLQAGSATFTHMRLLLEKYGPSLALIGRKDDELAIVKTVATVWLKSPQHVGLILAALLRAELICPQTIIRWMETPDAVQQYSWPYIWSILHDTLAFVKQEKTEEEVQGLIVELFRAWNRILKEHHDTCAREQVEVRDNWYRSLVAQMQEVGWKYRKEMEASLDQVRLDVLKDKTGDQEATKVVERIYQAYRG